MSGGQDAHSKKVRFFLGAPALAAIVLLAISGHTQANILGPYLPDVDTLHLWHMNEQVVPVIDVGPDGVHLSALRNGATLGNVSFRGFGTALSTYDAGPEATTDIGRDAYLAGRPLVNGLSDNISLAYMGASKAFTYEALLRIDFDPLTNYSTNAPGNGRGTCMQVLSLDADENTNRVCQLLVVPIGVFERNSQPLLQFVNLDRDHSPQILTAAIPTNGPDAIALNSWYHLAVSYDGVPGAPDNLKFYWTLLDPTRITASLIGSGRMLNDLPAGCAPDFAIGQTGRQSPGAPYPNNNFVGLIDEVRMSASARAPSQMMFGSREIASADAALGNQTQAPEDAPSSKGSKNAIRSKRIISGAEPSAYYEYLERGNVPILIALGLIACLLLWLGIVLKRAIPQRKTGRNGLTYAIEERAQPSQDQPAPERPSNPGRNSPRDPGTTFHKRPQSAPANHNKTKTQVLGAKNPGETAFVRRTPAAKPAPVPEAKPLIEQSSLEDELGSSEGTKLQDEVGFRGILRKVGLQDVIQMECLNRKSSILEIKTHNLQGRLYIEQGEIIQALAGETRGEDAFHQLLSLTGGEFSLKPFVKPEERPIREPWIQLLMESARRRDEKDSTASDERDLTFRPSTSVAEDLLTMAALLADHPQVREVLVCTKGGEPVYSSKCNDPAARAEVCTNLSRAAKIVAKLLPVGELKHLEILSNQSRTIMQEEQNCQLLVGIAHEGAAPL